MSYFIFNKSSSFSFLTFYYVKTLTGFPLFDLDNHFPNIPKQNCNFLNQFYSYFYDLCQTFSSNFPNISKPKIAIFSSNFTDIFMISAKHFHHILTLITYVTFRLLSNPKVGLTFQQNQQKVSFDTYVAFCTNFLLDFLFMLLLFHCSSIF